MAILHPGGRARLCGALGRPAAAVVAALTLGVACAGGGGGERSDAEVGSGLPSTEAPWAPSTQGLRERVEAAGFPPVGDESYHVHALLSVFVDGEPVEVPANIGIDIEEQFMSPLHTHTPDGVLHFEADDPASFTLGQVFSMWGVDFGPERLEAHTPDGSKRIHVYVNGREQKDPVGYAIADGDNIVVAYGEAGSFPIEPPDDALRNV